MACESDQDDPIEEDEEPQSSDATRARGTQQQSQHTKQRRQAQVHNKMQLQLLCLYCLLTFAQTFLPCQNHHRGMLLSVNSMN